MKKIYKEVVLKDGTKITLRDPKISEAKAYLEHLYVCAKEVPFLLGYPDDIKKRTIESEKNWVRNFINSQDLLIVADYKGKVVGLSEVRVLNGHKVCHRGNIGISIKKKFCERGLGSILFDEMIEYANRIGLEKLELGVIEGNTRARHLYEKKGFKYTGSIPCVLKNDDGTYYDELLMSKFLS